jgi:hypothetical protein
LAISELTTAAAEPTDPLSLYRRRLDSRRDERSRLARREEIVANLRGVSFLAAAVVGWLAFAGTLAWGWLAVPAIAFVALVIVHVRLRRAFHRAERAVAYYERGVERAEGRWAAHGEDGSRFADESHPFAADLDLFGHGSLFQRLNTARTSAGESALAGWLKRPQASAETIRDRQAAVADLASRLELREELDLLGDDVRVGLDSDALVAWGDGPPLLPDRRLRTVALALGLVGAASLAGWLFGVETGETPVFAYAFFATVLVELAFWSILRKRLALALAPVDRRADELDLLAGLLRRLETESFRAPALRALCDDLVVDGQRPSARIAALARLVRRLDGTRNPMIAPFAALLMTGTRLAFAVEDWRLRSGRAIAACIDGVGRIEAFGSLGAYAFESPDDPYPEFVEDGPLFDAEAIGHPLIPPERNVRNTLSLGGALRVLVISGSNMSGKSTLLRTVGINAVLAMVGAPVKAARLRLSPLELGATLRVQDSLQAGSSRFYAELTRLRQVVELAGGSPPLLFLLDEIFHGTNSDDRRVGAGGVVRGLIDRGAIGLVTTHDLALATIAEGLAPRAANVHFSDRFEDGSLVFDYTMKPGVVEHSNALALMRAVGLDV